MYAKGRRPTQHPSECGEMFGVWLTCCLARCNVQACIPVRVMNACRHTGIPSTLYFIENVPGRVPPAGAVFKTTPQKLSLVRFLLRATAAANPQIRTKVPPTPPPPNPKSCLDDASGVVSEGPCGAHRPSQSQQNRPKDSPPKNTKTKHVILMFVPVICDPSVPKDLGEADDVTRESPGGSQGRVFGKASGRLLGGLWEGLRRATWEIPWDGTRVAMF